MRLTITVADPDKDRSSPILLDTSPGTTVGDLLEHLTDVHGLGVPGGACRIGDRVLDPAAPLADAGVREGVHLDLGASGPTIRQPPVTGPVLAELHLAGGPGSGRVWPLRLGTYDIGTGESCAIRLEGEGAAEGVVYLTVAPDGSATLRTTGGTTVRPAVIRPPEPKEIGEPDPDDPDTARAKENTTRPDVIVWPSGGDVALGAHLLHLAPPAEADADVVPSADGLGLDFNRPPRIVPPIRAGRFRLPVKPQSSYKRPFPLLITLAPMALGLVMVQLFKSYFFLVFAVFSPLMALANWIASRRSGRKDHLRELARHRERKAATIADATAAIEEERRARVEALPDPAAVALAATGPGRRLWERRRSDPDHLVLRVGTVDQPSLTEVDDTRGDGVDRDSRWTVPDVPLGVDLADCGVLGVAGEGDPAGALMRWLVVQAAVLHGPHNVQLRLLTPADASSRWDWTRWLPHARGTDASGPAILIGNDPETIATRVAELVQVVRTRTEAASTSMRQAVFADPDIVLVLDGARRLREIPGMVQVLQEGPAVRVFSICLDTEERFLPQECTAVVRFGNGVGDGGRRVTLRRHGQPEVDGIRPDLVDVGRCEEVARAVAPIRDVTSPEEGALPGHVALLDLIGLEPPDPDAVLDVWRRRPASTQVRLGVGYDGPLAFDLVRDGPHALIAGTTGSGKSELLQSFVASLAAVNRPDELTFVLVDYKGGSAFKDCVELPHTLGMVTDLDAQLVHRAMASLGAELTRREVLLAGVGAKDHAEYRAKRARDTRLPALPRLLLIVDEFATLVREVPEFIPGLVGIAQRGRSLGLHMVLATQRPAGVVTADIRANTSLRIALRVTDAAESQDVIESRDAVAISSTTPGRALARVAHRTVIPFQTAYAGGARAGNDVPPSDGGGPATTGRAVVAEDGGATAPGRPRSFELGWGRIGRPRPAEPEADEGTGSGEHDFADSTDLRALVAAIGEAAGRLPDFEPQPSPWLDPLPGRVLLDDLPPVPATPDRAPGSLPMVAWALEDVPQRQTRRPVLLDLSTFGHLYVIGAPRSGRSQLLRTLAVALARRHSSGVLHFQAIDAAGGALSALGELPHCGTVVPRNDLSRIDRMITRISEELTVRQELLARHACANLAELRAEHADGCPAHLVLFIDGWDAVVPVLSEFDNGRLLNEVVRILREGAAAGVHAVLTSERALLTGRLAALNDNRVILRLSDRTDFASVGVPRHAIPGNMPEGRALLSGDWSEAQVALPAAGSTGREQADALRALAAETRARDANVAQSRRPFTIAALPAFVTFADAYDLVPAGQARPLWGLLGLGGDTAAPVGVDFAGAQHTFSVIGPPGSGRSNTLACLAVSLLASGTRVVAFTPRDSPLRQLVRHPLATVVEGTDADGSAIGAAVGALDGPAVVVVDDGDLLAELGSAPGRVLREVASAGRDRGIGLVYAATAETVIQSVTGWIGEARRSRKGVLLNPQLPGEGDLVGLRLPADRLRQPLRAGHAWMRDDAGALSPVLIPLTELRADG